MRLSVIVKNLTAGLVLALAIGCGGQSIESHIAKGDAFVAESKFKEAALEYRAALQKDTKRGDVRMKLAEVNLKNGDLVGTLQEYVRAADLLPNDAKAQTKAAGFLVLARAYEDAKTRVEKALAIDPKNVEALIIKGNALAGLKDLDGAVSEFQEALTVNPAQDSALANIGMIQAARGQKQEAETTFLKAVEVAPKSLTAHLALANFYWSTGRQKDAEDSLKIALTLDPTNVSANRALGVFYMSTNRQAEAEPYFQAMAKAANSNDAVVGLSDYYIAVNRPEDAKKVLRDLAAKADGFAPATVRLAAIEAAQNNRSVAESLVDSVLEKSPKYSAARSLKVRLLLAADKPDEAVAAAQALIKDEDGSLAATQAHFVVGGVLVRRDRTDEAIREFEAVLKAQPQSLPASIALASLNMSIGAIDKAETFTRQAMALQPKNPTARAMLARLYLAKGDRAKAATEVASLQKDFPNAPMVLNLVAANDLIAGRLDAAKATFQKVNQANPADMEALEGLTTVDMQAGRTKEAISRIEGALARVKPTAGLYVLAARAYAAAKDVAKAEEFLKKSIDLEPNRLLAYSLLGQLYVSQNRLPDAKEKFTQLVTKNPRSVSAGTMLGMILEAQGDAASAEARYQKTLEADPEAAVAANNLAWMYVSTNRNLDQALELAQVASKRLPSLPQVNDTLGWIYFRKGMFRPAVEKLELSVQKDQSDASVFYHLGMAYAEVGEIDKAKKALTKALAMSTTFPGADEAKKTLSSLGR